MRGFLAAVLLIAACCVAMVHGAAPARAAGCVAPSIAVVVDFGSLGGGVQRACTGAGGSGLTVLGRTFGYTLVTGEPFVCRIAGRPGVKKNPCTRTPPSNAYWAYFHVLPGHSAWSYSSLGAGSYTPPAGSAEGWSFGGGRAPIYPAAAALPSRPAPPHTTPPKPPKPRTTAPRRSPASQPVPLPPLPTSSRQPVPSSRPSSSTTAGSEPPASVEPTSAVPSIADVPARAAPAKPQHGSPVPTILGLALVGLLAVIGAVLMVRRRSDL